MHKPSWGVIFDWDGVIIDSSAFHERSWELVAEREGLVLPPDHFHRGFGKRNEEIIPEMLRWASEPAEVRRLADAKEEAYRGLIRGGGIRPLPGVAVWLDRLEAAGVPFAVGSSTPRENIDCVLGLWGWEGRFAAVVASADVVRGKPDPEVFLKAAAAIGVLPSCAVVFEDAPMGVEAGLAAGARVVAVAGTHPAGTFPQAHRVVRRMDELQVAELAAWFPARKRQASGLIRGPGFGNLAKRSTPMREWTKIVLTEDEMPRQWYNIQADLSHPLPPPVDKEGNPIGPDALAPVFPMNLIEQEMSTERWIDIPEPVLEILSLWRPSPLYRARRLEKALGTPAKIFYKNEGVSPPGSHKPNTAVVQAYYNKEFGIKRLTTETGAGQWGSALAMGCKLVGLECKVYMVRISFDQKPFRKIMMQTWGANCVASPSEQTEVGRRILQEMPDTPGSLGIAISEAIEDAVTSKDTRYSLGSVLNHVLMHQTIIGLEAKKQFEKIGAYPDVVIGCAGGGSNFAGLAFPFVADKMTGREVRVIATEPTACPTLTRSPFVYDSGDVAMMTPLLAMHSLGHTFVAAPIHAGGLRYHGIAPLVSHVLRENLIEASALDQLECYQAAVLFAHTEGFISAPETSHAIAQTIREARQAKEEGKEKVILMNWSGHGLMDLTGYQAYFEGKLSDYVLPEELMQRSLASLEGLPKPPPLGN